MSRLVIVKWYQMFQEGHTDLGKGRKTSNSEHIRHGAASGRHYSQQLQSERSTLCVFGNLKQHLGERQFSNNNQVLIAVLSWLRNQGAIFYRQGIERLVERSDKCLQRLGDYVERAACVS